jgi:hypothetical protein
MSGDGLSTTIVISLDGCSGTPDDAVTLEWTCSAVPPAVHVLNCNGIHNASNLYRLVTLMFWAFICEISIAVISFVNKTLHWFNKLKLSYTNLCAPLSGQPRNFLRSNSKWILGPDFNLSRSWYSFTNNWKPESSLSGPGFETQALEINLLIKRRDLNHSATLTETDNIRFILKINKIKIS